MTVVVTHMRTTREEHERCLKVIRMSESGVRELPSQGEQVRYLYKRSVVRAQSKSESQVRIGKRNDSE
jgi:hypothetical protein